MPRTEPETGVPILTDVIIAAGPALPPLLDRDTLVAELQTKLAARTFALTDELLRSAFAQMEASVFQQITAKLRRELPELIDATLREHLGEDRNQE